MDFTRLRLSGPPATSPRVVDAPSSPTKSVYLDMDETTPTSPQMLFSDFHHTDEDGTNNKDDTTIQATPTSTVKAVARRTNFFDPDSSDDDDEEDEEELTTADELGFSQRHSLASSVANEGMNRDGEYGRRGRSLTRYSPATSASPTTTATTTTTHAAAAAAADGGDAHHHHRKDAFYLGVRPEEYAFVCGERPASSTIPDDDDDDDDYHHADRRGPHRPVSPSPQPPPPPLQSHEGGLFLDHGYSRYDVPDVVVESPRAQQQRQTLRGEGVSPKHVPFGAPDLAVAARRVLSEQRRKKAARERERDRFVKVKASSSVLPYSASEYEDGSMMEGSGGNGNLQGAAPSYGLGVSGTALGDGVGSEIVGGKDVVERVPDGFEKAGNEEAAETQSLQDKTDNNILGVHAITLQALLRNEEGLQANASSVRRKSASSEFSRREFLKSQSKSQLLQDSAMSLPPPVPQIPPMAQIQQPKRVSLVPPPIDTSRSPGGKSEGKVKTPYPFHHHRRFPKTLGSPGLPPPAQDNILTLSIRRRTGVLSSRVARVTLPAELLGGSAAGGFRNDDIAPEELPPPLFDDAAFFKQLRIEYARLAGRWWRFFSARSLRRITVGHTSAWSATESCPSPAFCGGGRCCPAAGAAHGGNSFHQQQQRQHGCSAATPSGIYHVRSPRYLASQGLKDTFSEENLLAHFRKPRLGRYRFAWVLWASRMAGLHEQQQHTAHLSGWRGAAAAAAAAAPPQRREKDAVSSWRDRELPPTPAGAAGAHGRTPSTASTAFAAASSDDDDAKDGFFLAQAELGVAGGAAGIGPGHSVATLEFVEGWSVARILAAVLLVLLLAAAGIVLWTLFGTGTLVNGFRGSGARVGTAVLIGTGVLFFGWTLVLAWMGVSWCVV
ncbi:uncharacterized protein BKCO1_800062 [Diplodia corticola]|uniref:Uncharacterized protein n=1 Tax=Diplodia corticola TaxID=236234 RepID=A0A1J9SB68_9PEZI|nr:uncharacterized protein BKCO1_800062 [Diplodia corticola]OJD37100.1 hypothetical protein BKCO1_800062 [Diplodia corticola]